jgi:hypothetical protein
MKRVILFIEYAAEPLVYTNVMFVRWASSPILAVAVAGTDNYLYMELSDGQKITIKHVSQFSVE